MVYHTITYPFFVVFTRFNRFELFRKFCILCEKCCRVYVILCQHYLILHLNRIPVFLILLFFFKSAFINLEALFLSRLYDGFKYVHLYGLDLHVSMITLGISCTILQWSVSSDRGNAMNFLHCQRMPQIQRLSKQYFVHHSCCNA